MYNYRSLTDKERTLITELYASIPTESGDLLDWTLQRILEKFLSLNKDIKLKVQDKNSLFHYIPLASIVYDTELSAIASHIILPYGFSNDVHLEIKPDTEDRESANVNFDLHASHKYSRNYDTTI